MSAEAVQSFLWKCHRVLYVSVIGRQPGAWRAFLERHGDAWRVSTREYDGCVRLSLPHRHP